LESRTARQGHHKDSAFIFSDSFRRSTWEMTIRYWFAERRIA